MQLRIVIIALVVALSGCTTSRETFLADGSKGYNISCDSGMGNCLQKAGETCGPKGYSVVNQQAGVMVTGSIFIKCKE